jgi:hypothetical protein
MKPLHRTLLTSLALLLTHALQAAPTQIGIIKHPSAEVKFTDEWLWALRGGGAMLDLRSPDSLTSISPDTVLLILDSIPLSSAATHSLEGWVKKGGLVIYSGGPEIAANAEAQALFGIRFAGRDPGQMESYPRLIRTSPLTSPLLEGDALRLGTQGLGHNARFDALDRNERLALTARLSPGPGGFVVRKEAPTLITHRLGAGRVVFAGFSLGRVGSCYPEQIQNQGKLDCSGASGAHALMRWLTVNLLWEERKLSIPLLWDAPGNRPHAVIITGDVHNNRTETSDWASVRMAEIAERTGTPISLYLEGQIAQRAPDFLAKLKSFKPLEISSHGLNGRVYLSQKYLFRSLGILHDLWKAESLLGMGHFPDDRKWLSSTRSHGWISDRNAWWAMRQMGIGLVFDQVADSLVSDTPWRVMPSWFSAEITSRLYIPLFEHSISTAKDDFLLDADQALDIANLASAQPEPVASLISYPEYTAYVKKWHNVIGRLSSMGGLTEVWLWHPEGVMDSQSFAEVENTLRDFHRENSVTFIRGDVVATWRANRERLRVKPVRNSLGELTALTLEPLIRKLLPLPPGAPDAASSVGYWVMGPAKLPGWSSYEQIDPLGRVVTLLSHPLPTPEIGVQK